MTTILLTGGGGFIGSNLARRILDTRSERLIVLDSLTYAGKQPEFEDERFEFWHGDVRNGELVDSLVAQSDVVIHMAAETHVTRSIFDDRLFFETDVLGTQVLANAVARHKERVQRFIHVSTSEVYGNATAPAMDENHPLNPMSPYASAKCGADRLVFSYWSTYGIPAVIVRPFNNFGPRQHLEKAIPRFITSCLLGEPITIHGDGSAARDWLFVDDHCDAIEAIIDADPDKVVGEVFNLGSGEHRSVLEVATMIRGSLACAAGLPIEHLSDRPGQVARHTCDSGKARRVLGWSPKTSFEEALERTIAWYRDHTDWWESMRWMRHIPIVTADGEREMH